ncbi:MAG TPA: hypothetical protein VFJ96_08790 [Gemmatimonadaceae bacterium]|nr:hypothetical protein [Gemmatimonadaceae bacterium]
MGAVRRLLRRASGAYVGFLVLSAATVHAQAASSTTPEAFAKRYVATLSAGDFAANAALMHPTALAAIRRFVVGVSKEDSSGATLQQIVGVHSAAALDSLSDAQVYARFLSAVLSAEPGALEAMKSAKVDIIGHVDEAPNLTHVVYRMTMNIQGIEMRKVDVLTLKRDGKVWRATLTTDIENLISRLSGPST